MITDRQILSERLERIEVALTQKNDEVLNANQAASYLDISLSHLYRLTSERRLQYYKPGGGRIYFRKSELDAYILARPVSTREEIKILADRFINTRVSTRIGQKRRREVHHV